MLQSEPILSVQGLRAGYGRAEVLHGVDLRIAAGQIVALVGPNGAGKTTAMHAIMRVLPSTGRVLFQGRPLDGVPTEDLVGSGLVLVPETRALFADMAVEDNLLLGAFARRRHIGALLAELEPVYAIFPRLRERRRQLAGTLSGGEQQMLAVGRALMAKPALLLLDEPSLGLAPRIVQEMFRVLETLRQAGLAILLVEQNARAALRLADYGYVLELGTVIAEGPTALLREDPRVLDVYMGQQRPVGLG
jgi:branched-chain amino acid transport system ATP-binding protein